MIESCVINILKNATSHLFNEILCLKFILNNNYKYIVRLNVEQLLSIIKQFISDETMNILTMISKNSQSTLDLLESIDILYSYKPKHYPFIKMITTSNVEQNILDKYHNQIQSMHQNATIIRINDDSIIGGCILEIDNTYQCDASYRLALSNVICKIKNRLNKEIK